VQKLLITVRKFNILAFQLSAELVPIMPEEKLRGMNYLNSPLNVGPSGDNWCAPALAFCVFYWEKQIKPFRRL